MQQIASKNTWLTRVEAIEILQVSPFTFVGLVKEGRIRKRDTGRRRYWREDIERIAAPPPAA